MATVPITSSTITPPFVTDISHSSLVKWKRLRHKHEEAVKARCITSGEDADKAMLSVKNSFDSHLLEMLCKYDWDPTVEQVSEQRIINEINKTVNNVKNEDIGNVDLLIETKFEMNLSLMFRLA
ncbi:hypothetical protein PHMEG_00032669 [Phytophthora megakarya]|uniref:Uncharacterized protein n=1 Tax=Phytophthora megakarya TaxID=4795 RepID=A0A225UVI1_9STRA|nr:hypothetical protein PHMEG_00032669 [Phytophthora megakarya]